MSNHAPDEMDLPKFSSKTSGVSPEINTLILKNLTEDKF